ncbi:MAG TPA: hypothetical protein VE152_13575 [Acidimicrobiales bacterium]|nr:hypothetical protein [Acidimicrobiales bacterium]
MTAPGLIDLARRLEEAAVEAAGARGQAAADAMRCAARHCRALAAASSGPDPT